MSSTTYTYVKSIKNLIALIGQIQQQITTRKLDYYNYDDTITTLSLVFDNSLDSSAKLVLDNIITTFVDKTTLNSNDIANAKYIRLVKSSEQSLPTTVNTSMDILFQSTSYIDRLYYQTSASSKFIFIAKPGIYIFMAKVGAYGSTFVSNTVLQWTIQIDDTRTDTTYLPIQSCATYTYHNSENNMYDGGLVSCLFNVNPITGTNVKLVCKLISGATPLTLSSEMTSFSIISVPGISYYEGNISTSVAQSLTTPTVFNYGTDRIKQYPFTHTLAQSSVTISKQGFVLILAKSTLSKTSGTDATSSILSVMRNGVVIDNNARSYSAVLTSVGKTTTFVQSITRCVAGDVITMQSQLSQGSFATCSSGETGIIIIYLSSEINNSMSLSYFNREISNPTQISATPVDVLLETMEESLKNYVAMTTNDYIVTDFGLYLITANISLSNTSGFSKLGSLYIVVSNDSGRTYYYLSGSLMNKQINPNGKTSFSLNTVYFLPSNTRIKFQVLTNGTVIDNIIVTDSSSYLFLNFFDLSNFPNTSSTFGQYFNLITSTDSLIVTNTNFIEKCRLTTRYLPSGVYRIGTNMNIVSTDKNNMFSVQLVDVSSASNISSVVYTKNVQYTEYFNSVDYMNFSEGGHTLILQVCSLSGIAITCKNVVLEMWKAQ